MEDAGVVVGVERRNTRFLAEPNTPVCLRAVRRLEDLNARIADIDADRRRHDHARAVDEDIQVGVNVMDEGFFPFRLQPAASTRWSGLAGAGHGAAPCSGCGAGAGVDIVAAPTAPTPAVTSTPTKLAPATVRPTNLTAQS
jgi:hypothetical protein